MSLLYLKEVETHATQALSIWCLQLLFHCKSYELMMKQSEINPDQTVHPKKAEIFNYISFPDYLKDCTVAQQVALQPHSKVTCMCHDVCCLWAQWCCLSWSSNSSPSWNFLTLKAWAYRDLPSPAVWWQLPHYLSVSIMLCLVWSRFDKAVYMHLNSLILCWLSSKSDFLKCICTNRLTEHQ